MLRIRICRGLRGPEEDCLRFAVWGCGSIGRRHLRNVLDLGYSDIVAFDVDPERRKAVGSTHTVQVVDTEADLLRSGADVTVIATPTIHHQAQLFQLLRDTDSHVFVEKPACHTADGTAELLELADRKGVRVMVACNWRFHPGVAYVRELLERGTIGQPVSARVEGGSYLPSWHPSEDYRKGYSARRDLGGGCLLDCIHEVDYANWMFGRPSQVVGFHDNLGDLGIETEDAAALLIRYESGTLVTVNLDYVQRPSHRSCRIVGREGTIEWVLSEGRVRWFRADRGDWCEWRVPEENAVDRSYVAEIRHFIEAVLGRGELMSDLREGIRAVSVVDAARESQRDGRIVQL